MSLSRLLVSVCGLGCASLAACSAVRRDPTIGSSQPIAAVTVVGTPRARAFLSRGLGCWPPELAIGDVPWDPPARLVLRADSAVRAQVTALLLATRFESSFDEYARQYIGVVRGTDTALVVIGTHAILWRKLREHDDLMRARAGERAWDEPLLLCDAGKFQFMAAIDATGRVRGAPVFARTFDGR